MSIGHFTTVTQHLLVYLLPDVKFHPPNMVGMFIMDEMIYRCPPEHLAMFYLAGIYQNFTQAQ